VDDPSTHLLKIYRGDSRHTLPDNKLAALTADVIVSYVEQNKLERAPNWPRTVYSAVGKTFQRLGELKRQGYPPFHLKLLPTPRTINSVSRSLGRADWPELVGCASRDREQKALTLVYDAARAQFEQAEAIFNFGQQILLYESRDNDLNPDVRSKIKTLLQTLLSQLKTSGQCGLVNDYGNLNLADVWESAGLPTGILKRRYLETLELQRLALSCLGATSMATTAVKIMFCCASGWNRSQIEDLPAEPFAYREADEAGLGETAFLSEFKARAGHFVNALLERGFRKVELSEEQRKIVWNDSSKAAPDLSSTILNDGTLLDILDRYKQLTEPIRHFDKDDCLSHYYFISLMYKGASRSRSPIPKGRNDVSILSRPEVIYPIIRQSYISAARRRLGSLDITKHISNHTGTAIILSHYDDPVIQQELDEAIAFWQNCMQTALLRRNRDLQIRVQIPDQHVEWFYRMSTLAGITAALGIKSRRLSVSERKYVDFVPSHSNLRDLYVIRRALVASRHEIGLERWRVQALPLLAFVKAIRKHAFNVGLGSQYIDAAHSAVLALKDKTIVFPRIFGQ